jgi:hypothetical protein
MLISKIKKLKKIILIYFQIKFSFEKLNTHEF